MKGCLKLKSPSLPGFECLHTRKCVAFCSEGDVEVFPADEWDRTPTEPARKLSYQDLLELKEIQRSLPRANQLPDPISGRPPSQFLSAVPIGLLPLLSDSDCGSSQNSSYANSPTTSPPPSSPTHTIPGSGQGTTNWSCAANYNPHHHHGYGARAVPPPSSSVHSKSSSFTGYQQHVQHQTNFNYKPTSPSHLSHLTHLLPTQAPRPKPRFAFVPLLDSPTKANEDAASAYPPSPPPASPSPTPSFSSLPSSSTSDPDSSQPTTPSLTTASASSRASSGSPEPPYFQLPPPRRHYDETYGAAPGGRNGQLFMQNEEVESYFPVFEREELYHPSDVPMPVPQVQAAAGLRPGPVMEKKKRRNIIVVNDIEIELDADDEDEEEEGERGTTPPASAQKLSWTRPITPQPHERPTPISIPPSSSSPPQRSTPSPKTRPPPSSNPTQSIPLSPPTPTPSAASSGQGQAALYAPMRFKRAPPASAPSISTTAAAAVKHTTSPPPPSANGGAGGGSCSPQYKNMNINIKSRSPSSSPVLVPSA